MFFGQADHPRRRSLRTNSNWRVLIVAALLIFRQLVAESATNGPTTNAAKPRIVFGSDKDYPPFEWLDKNGQPQGFNVDLIHALGKVMGWEVEVRLGNWPEIRQALETSGTVDVSDMFKTEERAQTAGFSVPFWVVHDEIFVRRGKQPIGSLNDLAGREVLCQEDSAAANLLRQSVPTAKLVPVDSEPEALRRLASGQHDCAVVTRLVGRYAIVQNDLRNLTTTGAPLWPRDYSFVTAKGRPELVAQINEGLAILKATGRFDEIYDKWFAESLPRKPWLNQFVALLPWIALGLTVLAIGVTAWIRTLRHKVHERTRELSESEQQLRLALDHVGHLNRVYVVLSDINQTIVRVKDKQTLLETACRIAVEKGGFRMAWIGLTDAGSGSLKIHAHAGADAGTLEILRAFIESGSLDSCFFTRHALQTGTHGACNDIAQDPQAASWRDAALGRNYLAMGSFPLKDGDKVIGTFNLYAGEKFFFNEPELRLLDELAMDISFALEVHEHERLRLQAEQDLRASEERFRQVVENIREAFWITDPATNQILYVSPGYEAIWGRTCASLYTSSGDWLEAVHPEDRPQILHAIQTKRDAGDFDETFRIRRPDSSLRWVRSRAFAVRNETGEVHRIVGTAEDVTAHQQLEEQLRQAQKLEAIGQLAGGVAHDFNNILAAMMMQAELTAMTKGLPAQAAEGLQEIRVAAERAANLTRQLLLFGRRQVMQTHNLDLNEVVTSLTKMLQRIISEDVRLELSLNPAPLFTRADAGMLDQVLMNLAVNARDAMPDGGRLTIETFEKIVDEELTRQHPDAAPGRYVCLCVRDTGTGIPPEVMPRIFEPFFTTKAPGKGTGLGLATVFGIVKQHRGWVKVHSEPGHGTNFQVFLPASTVASPEAARATDRRKINGGTETILLAEDDDAVRLLTRAILEGRGYRVLEATSGAEALALWPRHCKEIALLLTDLVMPGGISGLKLAGRLQADNPKLKVIYTSGYSAEIAGCEVALRAGENFVQKPTSPEQLLEIIRRCLDGSKT